jgi:hypothetical protein
MGYGKDKWGNQQIASPLDRRPDGHATWTCAVYKFVCANSGISDGKKAAHLDCCDCDAKYWMEREIGGWRTTTSKQPPRRYPCALSWRLWRTGDSIPDCYFCCTWDIWDGNILCIFQACMFPLALDHFGIIFWVAWSREIDFLSCCSDSMIAEKLLVLLGLS